MAEIKSNALASIGRYFASPEGLQEGADIVNVVLARIERKRGKVRLKAADFLAIGKGLVLLDVPAEDDTVAADMAAGDAQLVEGSRASVLDVPISDLRRVGAERQDLLREIRAPLETAPEPHLPVADERILGVRRRALGDLMSTVKAPVIRAFEPPASGTPSTGTEEQSAGAA